ncbi:MAG: tRNA-dihydrouridine synthase, partial [Aeromonas sobria]
NSPEKARYVLDYTGVDAVMIGRAAQGRPWIFREIRHFLETGTKLPPPDREEGRTLMNEHVTNLHQFYGAYLGARIARKHVGWYLDEEETGREFRKHFNALDCADAQLEALEAYFDGLG